MKNCSICRSEIKSQEPPILFIANNGDKKEICSECEKQMDIMTEGNNIDECKSAINYLYTCYSKNEDYEVVNFLVNAVDVNAKEVIRKENEQIDNSPVNTDVMLDYFADNKNLGFKQESYELLDKLQTLTWFFVVPLFVICFFMIFISLSGFFLGIIAIVGLYMYTIIINIFIKMSEEITEIKSMFSKKIM